MRPWARVGPGEPTTMPERLFHVAPDAVFVRALYDPESNTWVVSGSTVRRRPDGEHETEVGDCYRYLTADEALTAICAVAQGPLGLL